MPVTNFLSTLPTTTRVALEPAHTLLNSLVLLNKVDMMPGANDWVEKTAASLTPAQKHANLLVMEGLYHALDPQRSWSSFPAYIQYMEREDPRHLRQRMFDSYERMCGTRTATAGAPDIHKALATPGSYLDYLYERFPDSKINVQIETESYNLLKEPAAMRNVIVNHLWQMWETILAAEWQRSLPLLQSCVAAFHQINLADKELTEAARLVVGQDLPEWWQKNVADQEIQPRQVIFVPSPHLGPYVSQYKSDTTLWLLFGARLPQGSLVNAPDLSRSELLVRINALADDTRLRILQLIKDKGELCSQDIRDHLQLSQSAGSRHLKQLSATGYLLERRLEGAKCYALNADRIEDTLQALSYFLSKP